MHVNRDWDGLYRKLRAMDEILVPDLEAIPTPDYPECSAITTFPCLYEVKESGFFFEWIATLYYTPEDLANWIRDVNLGPCGVHKEYLQEGDIIVVPVPPE